jgi:hypothetical protein
MEETYEDLKELIGAMEDDAPKFFGKGTAAAGKRLRKNAMLIKKICHTLRQEITEEMNSK